MKLFFVVGEESGDLLGGDLIEALRRFSSDPIEISGTGGARMAAQGLEPLFDLSEIAVMGFTAVVARLPTILRRISDCVSAIERTQPDAVVIIDSPDFTHRVAAKVRNRCPDIPIIGYVSPSVWVWRQGRARKMSRYVDHLLAILPFEPEVHRRLDGPPCTYVGHPLLTRIGRLRPAPDERVALESVERPVLLVLPGSRRSETSRLLKPFERTLEIVGQTYPHLEVVIPAVDHLRDEIADHVANWTCRPLVVAGEEAKLASFRRAHAALAASGTVSLELALSGVPMVIAYKVDIFYATLRKISGITPVISLPNIILDETIVPELVEENAEPDILSAKLLPLLSEGPERLRQTEAFSRLDDLMRLDEGEKPAEKAASIVLNIVKSA